MTCASRTVLFFASETAGHETWPASTNLTPFDHFISALAQTQTPDATIQAIGGHLSRKMLEHYSHVRLDAKRRAVALLDPVASQPVQ